jgi:peptidoglycan/xylan/chitin deacetylase (PgdA/CDA1 family)
MSERDKLKFNYSRIPILMYHEIYKPEERDRFRGLTNPAYNTEINIFRKQMAWLFANNIKTLTIDDLFSQKLPPEKRTICLTFDDGWLGNYLYAYPILKEFGFKATFFIATELIGRPFYMTWDHLKEMGASGMSIQSHTVTHRPLTGMGEKEILFELLESKKAIEEKLGTKVNHLSLPHGSKNIRIWPLAKEVGYKSICTSDVGFQNWESDGPWLRRIIIGDGISEKKFQLIVQGKNQAIWGMIFTKGLKNMLRGIIGLSNYRKLYRQIYGIR